MPRKHFSPSGRLSVKVTPELHSELARIAAGLGLEIQGLVNAMIHERLPAYRHRVAVLTDQNAWLAEAQQAKRDVHQLRETQETIIDPNNPDEPLDSDVMRSQAKLLLVRYLALFPEDKVALDEVIRTGRFPPGHATPAAKVQAADDKRITLGTAAVTDIATEATGKKPRKMTSRFRAEVRPTKKEK